MFELELKNSEELTIRAKEKVVNINVAQFVIDAGLKVGKLEGAGEYEIGDVMINAIAISSGVIYRIDVDGVKIGLVYADAKAEDLDELGPIDILGTNSTKVVNIVMPKIVIPLGTLDFSEIKGEVKVEKRLKIKNSNSLPSTLTIYKLDSYIFCFQQNYRQHTSYKEGVAYLKYRRSDSACENICQMYAAEDRR